LVRSLINFGTVSPTLRFPLWILYSIAPIAFFTTSIYYFRIFIKNLRNKGVYVGLENLDEEEEIQI
jgi:TRAP-type C4-dicarboxylate transport system permease small subunit